MITIEVNQRIGIVAASGVGKSNTAFTLLEDLRSRKYPICVLDVKNEYGDLPDKHIIYACHTNAAELVDALKQTNSSVVVFMKDLSVKQKQKWIAKFLKKCHKVARDVPIMIVIEEVRLFAPQKKHPPSKEPIEDLAQGGRSEGYGCMLISQRCSNVEKDVLGSLTDLFIMQHTLDQDKDYLKGWLGRKRVEKLPILKKGQAFHIDFDHGAAITEVEFPLNPRKKKGGTPTPKAVDPTPLQPKKTKKEKEGSDMKWMIVGLFIAAGSIIIITFTVLYFYIRSREEDDGPD